MKLSLAYSPCPNDTFIFDAAVHKKIDTHGIDFEVTTADVEELNQKALKATVDITKLSYHAYLHVCDTYKLLTAGSALGRANGPLIIANKQFNINELENKTIAIPGRLTTANLLLSIAFPHAQNRKEYIFSDIEQAVLSGETDCGLIIHENRFTYQEKGLVKILDLGEYWEQRTQLPIPLGGIVIKRTLDKDLMHKVNRIIQNSIKYAYDNPGSAANYIKDNAQEMSPLVMQKHIELYVNDFSYDLGEEGKNAVERLLGEAQKLTAQPTDNCTDYFI